MIHFLAAYAFVFLAVTITFIGLAIGLQFYNMSKMVQGFANQDNFESNFKRTLLRAIPVFICLFISAINGIFFLIGIIALLLGK